MTMVEQPSIICRINRLDNVVRHLEEMRGSGSRRDSWGSSAGSPSTFSDGRSSSSPRSLNSCRPMDDVVSEAQHKGSLLYRLLHLEERVLEMCLQLEKEMEQHQEEDEDHHPSTPTKKSLKQLVKSCVRPKSKSKSKTKNRS